MNEKAAAVHIHTLGEFSVVVGETLISNQNARSKQVWRLFKYLIVNRRRPVPVETLIDALWEPEETENPLHALYSLTHRLRALLSPYIGSAFRLTYANNAYLWDPRDNVILDIDLFERYIRDAGDSRADDEKKAALLRQAIDLYKGDFFTESSDEIWIVPSQVHYKEMFKSAADWLTGYYLEKGALKDALATASKAVELDPYTEEHHIFFLRALIRMGHMDRARQHYEHTAEILYDEYGVKPSEALQNVMKEAESRNPDGIFTIQDYQKRLEQMGPATGAFLCDQDMFRTLYRWQERLAPRNGTTAFLVLLTVSPAAPPKDNKEQSRFEGWFATFAAYIVGSLRNSDVVCQFSKTQISVLMTCLTYEDCKKVITRITGKFFSSHEKIKLKIASKISAVEA